MDKQPSEAARDLPWKMYDGTQESADRLIQWITDDPDATATSETLPDLCPGDIVVKRDDGGYGVMKNSRNTLSETANAAASGLAAGLQCRSENGGSFEPERLTPFMASVIQWAIDTATADKDRQIAELVEALEALKHRGGKLSNICHNVTEPDNRIDEPRQQRIVRDCVRAWDTEELKVSPLIARHKEATR